MTATNTTTKATAVATAIAATIAAAPAPAATAPTAAPAVAPAPVAAERIRIEVPFCGLEAAAALAGEDQVFEDFFDVEMTPAAAERARDAGGLYAWGDDLRSAIARAWVAAYFEKLWDLTGIRVDYDPDTARACWDAEGFGFEWIEVDADPAALERLFKIQENEVRHALARALEPRSGFSPFASAIEEANAYDVRRMRGSLIGAGLAGILDAYQTDDRDGLVDDFLPDRTVEEIRDAIGAALEKAAHAALGPLALEFDVERAEAEGEILVKHVPTAWLPYLVNDDPSGLTVEERMAADDFAEEVYKRGFSPWGPEPLDIDPDVYGRVRVAFSRAA